MISSFHDRVGAHQFIPASPLWGYTPQLHEWAMKKRYRLEWQFERVDGKDHIPVFAATPIFEGEVLTAYRALGNSKKHAKERASEMMALSGHCVSTLGHAR
ncbi:hypothetical protein C8Q77DRAFT_1045750 [Trametes polyzona]|nr:hypothetical protein C8Q77DRAFT_1045750 [Trametes polyzona]